MGSPFLYEVGSFGRCGDGCVRLTLRGMWQREAGSEGLSQDLLRPVQEINERCIELMVQAARGEMPSPWPLVSQLRSLLRGSKADARRRAAQCIFLLVDFRFRDVDWWRWACGPGARPSRVGEPGGFERRAAVALARATLTLAWHLARSDRVPALVLLGVPSAVARLIGGLSLGDLDRIAEGQCAQLRPRWEDRPSVWRQLLEASQVNDGPAMRSFTLHALQLLAGDCTPEIVRAPAAQSRVAKLGE